MTAAAAGVIAAIAACTIVACTGSTPNSAPAKDAPWTDGSTIDASPPVPAGCVTDVTAGDHVYTCGGLAVDARIPPACAAPGCGLILVLHGDTGSGLLMDAHIKMRDLGAQHGFIVIAPSGPPYGGGQPGGTWHASNDATLVDMVGQFRDVFRVDPARIHVTGFSRGGFVTWRLLCDHADLFASAAPAGAGDGAGFGEATCFTSDGRAPSRHIPILLMVQIRDAAIASYHAGARENLGGDPDWTHARYTAADAVIETFEHGYETVPDGPWASAQGHCIAGSTTDPYAPQYAIPCKLPNGFTWGDEIMQFFLAHPRT